MADLIYHANIMLRRREAKLASNHNEEAFLALKDRTTTCANELNKLGKLYEKVHQIYLDAPD